MQEVHCITYNHAMLHFLYQLHSTAPALHPLLYNLSTASLQPLLYNLRTLYLLFSTASTHSTSSALPSLPYYPCSTTSTLQSLLQTQNQCGLSTPPSCPKHPQPQQRQLQLHPAPVPTTTIESPPVPSPPTEHPQPTFLQHPSQRVNTQILDGRLASIVCGLLQWGGWDQRSYWKCRSSVTMSTAILFPFFFIHCNLTLAIVYNFLFLLHDVYTMYLVQQSIAINYHISHPISGFTPLRSAREYPQHFSVQILNTMVISL